MVDECMKFGNFEFLYFHENIIDCIDGWLAGTRTDGGTVEELTDGRGMVDGGWTDARLDAMCENLKLRIFIFS